MAHQNKTSAAPEERREGDGGGLNHPTPASEESRGNVQPDAAGTGEVVHDARTITGTDGKIEIIEDSGVAAGDEIVAGTEMKALHDRAS